MKTNTTHTTAAPLRKAPPVALRLEDLIGPDATNAPLDARDMQTLRSRVETHLHTTRKTAPEITTPAATPPAKIAPAIARRRYTYSRHAGWPDAGSRAAPRAEQRAIYK